MGKYLKTLFPLVLFVGLLLAANWDYKKITWNTGDIISASFLTTGGDTSDVFDVSRKARGGRDYPDEVSFLMKVIEGTNSPGASVTFTLELSNDQTVWYANGTLKQITDTGTNAETHSDSKTLVMASSNNPLASIAVTEALVMTYDSTLNEAIIAQPWIGGDDSLAYVTSVANTRADTYTYSYGLLPQYRYARVIATGALTAGDTVTVGVDMSRIWK